MSHNTAVVNVRLPPELKAKLVDMADKDHRKLSEYVRVVLINHATPPT